MSKWKTFFAQPRLALSLALTLVAFVVVMIVDQTTPSSLHSEWVDLLIREQQEILKDTGNLTEKQRIELKVTSDSLSDAIASQKKWRSFRRNAPGILILCVLGQFLIYLSSPAPRESSEQEAETEEDQA